MRGALQIYSKHGHHLVYHCARGAKSHQMASLLGQPGTVLQPGQIVQVVSVGEFQENSSPVFLSAATPLLLPTATAQCKKNKLCRIKFRWL